MKKGSFLAALRSGALVFDGAMGTALYERGLLYSTSLDHACITKPDLVREIHQANVEAGADVLTTNTFGAGRFRLAPHGIEDQVREINLAAVALAREAAGDRAWVLGSVGPTGLMLKTVNENRYPEIQAAFREQAAVLAEAGVDGLILETFRQPEELELALKGVKAGSRGGLPILACASFDAFGCMSDGTGPAEVGRKMVDWGADAIGVNCSDGPAGVYETSTHMLDLGVPVVAVPNAGLPHRVEGRLAYRATPEYFQLFARRLYKAGIHGVGGCCGTTEEHVRKIAAASRMVGGGEGVGRSANVRDERISQAPLTAPGVEVVPTHAKGELGGALGQRFVISVEVNPPPGLSLEKALEGARLLREGGVDAINIADGPRASARMGNLALSVRVQQELDMPALMHVTTRDRNLLGLLAHLLASHELGVKNLCVITGDPPKMGAFPDATPVYDTDSVGLLRLIRGLNHGYDPGGKPLGGATSFFCATGAEPAAQDLERELDRLALKVEAGAEMVMTQPVYDPDVLHTFLERTHALGIPTLVGILPLASYRNAEFLHNEVPGMTIPEGIRKRMRAAGGGEAARAEGVLIAREMLLSVRERVAGAYIMPPFGRYGLALDVIEGIVR